LAAGCNLASANPGHVPVGAAFHERSDGWIVLGNQHGTPPFGDLMDAPAALLLQEYQELNAHLRANTNQFVNWFSFFLTASLIAAGLFVVAPEYRPALDGVARRYAVQIAFLLMHILAFIGILTFRRYILAANHKIEAIIQQVGQAGESPIPARFCQWMTDLMAAGYVVSYFIWFTLLFLA
jgi:hypothetical protein